MSLNTEPSIGLRQRNAPAVAAFQTRNLQASKEFHVDRKNIFDEPHKTNAVRNFREKYWESFLRSSEKSLLNSGTIISILFSLYFVFNQQFPTVLGKTITSYIPFVSGWATEKVLEFSEIFSIGLTLCLGIFSLVSNGLIIAYLDYQKTTEYKEFYTNEKKREDWEYENYIEGEQNEMIELYEAKGLSKVDAETVIKILSKQKQFFVDVMMKEELELMPPDERNPTLTATVIFFSYIFVGMTPLLPFIISFKYNLNYYVIIISAFVITESLFVCFGIFKSSFTMNRWWTVSLQMAVNGLLAFAIPFVFAQVTSYLFMNLNTVHLNL